jgi:hypothetical protein
VRVTRVNASPLFQFHRQFFVARIKEWPVQMMAGGAHS